MPVFGSGKDGDGLGSGFMVFPLRPRDDLSRLAVGIVHWLLGPIFNAMQT
jgi:hypothetical protein